MAHLRSVSDDEPRDFYRQGLLDELADWQSRQQEPEPRRRSRRWWLLLIPAILLPVGVFGWQLSRAGSHAVAPGPPRPTVKSARPAAPNLPVSGSQGGAAATLIPPATAGAAAAPPMSSATAAHVAGRASPPTPAPQPSVAPSSPASSSVPPSASASLSVSPAASLLPSCARVNPVGLCLTHTPGRS